MPNVDIESLLSKSSKYRDKSGSPASPHLTNGEKSTHSPASTSSQTRIKYSAASRPKVPNEAPDEADGFDWAEEEFGGNDISDGMAALSIKPQGSGYFGIASSSVLLRALRVNPWELTLIPKEYNFMASPYDATPTPKYLADTLIHSYFTHYHSSYPLLHEGIFKAQYEGTMTRPREEVWGLLLNAVMALGAWCINSESGTADLTFYQNAKQRITGSLLETGSLALVQALALLSNYVQKRNKPNTGWNYLSIAVRMAIGLGLHREFPGNKIIPLKQEMRRRVWYCLYNFESGVCVTYGRPITLPAWGVMDTRPVSNIHESDLTFENETMPSERTEPTLYSGLIAQCNFSHKTNEIFNRVISRPSPTAIEALEMNKRIDEFCNDMPEFFKDGSIVDQTKPWLKLAKYKLGWRFRNLRLILFRPFILQRVLSEGDHNPLPVMNSPEEKECRRMCLRSAHNTIVSVNEFIQTNEQTPMSVWYTIYYLFQACLIPLVCACSEPDSDHAQDWMDDVEMTKKILLNLSAKNRLAMRFLDVIERICVNYLQYEQEPAVPKNEWMTDIYSMFFDNVTNPTPEDAMGFVPSEMTNFDTFLPTQ